ncbi:hypothetical protein ABGB08_09450 [Acrocarpospora sp. B8E8]
MLSRGIGIAAKAPHAATAKLFVDFVLSQGQRAVAVGGLTSYRCPAKFGLTGQERITIRGARYRPRWLSPRTA